MPVSTRIASILFATCLAGWGIQHFILGEFIAGRAPAYPAELPGKVAWAYVSGLILILAAISIIKTRTAATCAGLMILVWAGGRNLVALLTSLDYGFILTSTNKSLTIGFGTLLVASMAPRNPRDKWTDPLLKHALIPASIFLGIFFVASGIQHFLFVPFVKTLVPTWIPGDVFWTYVSGAGMILAGIALITGIKRRLAALISSWMVFVWVIVLHIPRALTMGNANEWTAVFEALAVASIFTIIYHKSRQD